MLLGELIDGLGLNIVHGHGATTITGITDDSRQVRAGSMFIARNAGYVEHAMASGAAAIVADRPPAVPPAIAWIVAPRVDQPLAGRIAERFFAEPAKKLALIGITGTNGKTTTAFLIQHLLKSAGMTCGLIGTVWIDDGRDVISADLTTPGAIELSRLLARMVAHGCEAAVMEVSSHALSQGRAAALPFRAAVFTNLTGDHLDYHATMDEYLAAKKTLFDQLDERAWAVINADDPCAQRITAGCKARRLWCSLHEPASEPAEGVTCRATALELAADHSLARFDGPWGSVELHLPMVGRHNLCNALQAIAAANAIKAVARVVRQAMEHCPNPPGRLEPVRVQDKSAEALPMVLVDYAHTHDALENVLQALRPVTRGRLMVLFGCGGDRDRTKRPKMAAVACGLADVVVITSDNPRTEDPLTIIDEILRGVPDENRLRPGDGAGACTTMNGSTVLVEPDRAKAIARIIAMAAPEDVVLLAGKGHEDYQIIGKEKRHFDDREQAAAALAAR